MWRVFFFTALLFLSFSLVWTCGFAFIHPGRTRRKLAVVTCEGPAAAASCGIFSHHEDATWSELASSTPCVSWCFHFPSRASFLPSCRPVDEGQMGQMSDDSIRGERVKPSAQFWLIVSACAESIYCCFLADEPHKDVTLSGCRRHTRNVCWSSCVEPGEQDTFCINMLWFLMKSRLCCKCSRIIFSCFCYDTIESKTNIVPYFALAYYWCKSLGAMCLAVFLLWDYFTACRSDLWKCWQGARSACQLKQKKKMAESIVLDDFRAGVQMWFWFSVIECQNVNSRVFAVPHSAVFSYVFLLFCLF